MGTKQINFKLKVHHAQNKSFANEMKFSQNQTILILKLVTSGITIIEYV